MAIHFFETSQFEEIRSRIEQYLYDSVLEMNRDHAIALRSVEQFADSLEKLFSTLEQMYQNPKSDDHNTDQSLPIHKGRYRVFFKVTVKDEKDFTITFLDIDDNKQSNLDRFPSHRITSFDSDED